MSGFMFDPSADHHDLVVAEEVYVCGEAQAIRRVFCTSAFQRGEDGRPCGVGIVLDAAFPVCMVCCRAFSLLTRRHHCRACGNLVCYLCSPFTVGGQRVCVQCYYGQSAQHPDSHEAYFASSVADSGSEDGSTHGVDTAPPPTEEPAPAVHQFIARTDYNECTVMELREAYLALTAESVSGGCDRYRVSLEALYRWGPLEGALQSGVVSCSDIVACYDRVFAGDRSVEDSAHILLSFAQFVELAFALQSLIDEKTSCAPPDAESGASRGPVFPPNEAALRRFETMLAAAADPPPLMHRPQLQHGLSEGAGLQRMQPGDAPVDREAGVLSLQMKTFGGNLHKQDKHRPDKWRLRRVLVSGLVLSYYSGHVQKGAFSLQGPGTRAAHGQAVPAALLPTCPPGVLSALISVQSPSGPVFVAPPGGPDLSVSPLAFTVVAADGQFANFTADTVEDARHWVDVVSHNLGLSAKIAAHSSVFHRSRPSVLSDIVEDREGEV